MANCGTGFRASARLSKFMRVSKACVCVRLSHRAWGVLCFCTVCVVEPCPRAQLPSSLPHTLVDLPFCSSSCEVADNLAWFDKICFLQSARLGVSGVFAAPGTPEILPPPNFCHKKCTFFEMLFDQPCEVLKLRLLLGYWSALGCAEYFTETDTICLCAK